MKLRIFLAGIVAGIAALANAAAPSGYYDSCK